MRERERVGGAGWKKMNFGVTIIALGTKKGCFHRYPEK